MSFTFDLPSIEEAALSTSPKPAAKQVRHLYEEGLFIAMQASFELAGEWIEAASIDVIVVTYIKRSSGIWSPAEKKLAFSV